MTEIRSGVSTLLLIVAGIGYAGTVIYQNGTLIRQLKLKGLQGLLESGDRANGETVNANTTDTLVESGDRANGESVNANTTDTQDEADYTFKNRKHNSHNFHDRPLTLLEILRDDSDDKPKSWDYVYNLIEKRMKIRKALQDDHIDHAGGSWEYFVHNFIKMPNQIREALQDDSSKDFVDILKAWKPKYRPEWAHFLSDDDETLAKE